MTGNGYACSCFYARFVKIHRGLLSEMPVLRSYLCNRDVQIVYVFADVLEKVSKKMRKFNRLLGIGFVNPGRVEGIYLYLNGRYN